MERGRWKIDMANPNPQFSLLLNLRSSFVANKLCATIWWIASDNTCHACRKTHATLN